MYLALFALRVHILLHLPDSNHRGHLHSLLRETPSLSQTDSLSILMAEVLKVNRPIPDEQVDSSTEKARCTRFSLKYNLNRTNRRRIFAGSLLADDSWHALGASALESFGIYHSLTFLWRAIGHKVLSHGK